MHEAVGDERPGRRTSGHRVSTGIGSAERRRSLTTMAGPVAMAGPVVVVVVVVVASLTVFTSVRHPLGTGRTHAASRAASSAPPVLSRLSTASDLSTSRNWSGYVDTATSFNAVSASWVQPTVTCPAKNAWTLLWVGLDGWGSDTVEQGGTSIQCVAGVPHYTAFWEMWPTLPVQTAFAVAPGDDVTAGVDYSESTQQFTITVTDTTSGRSLTETKSCGFALQCARASAEWVAEAPSHYHAKALYPLADYGTVNFTSATVTDAIGETGPIDDVWWAASGIEQVLGDGQLGATVSQLVDGTSSFSDTWKRP